MTAIPMGLLNARRAFPRSQELLAGHPLEPWRDLTVGWHDTSLDSETGAFAVIGQDSGLDDLLEQVVVVRYALDRAVYAYVGARAATVDPVQLSLARRCYAGLVRLSLETIECSVALIQ